MQLDIWIDVRFMQHYIVYFLFKQFFYWWGWEMFLSFIRKYLITKWAMRVMFFLVWNSMLVMQLEPMYAMSKQYTSCYWKIPIMHDMPITFWITLLNMQLN